jgi:hypothetical protein
MDASTARSKWECTAFHKPESLPNNCLRNNYDNMDTIKAKLHPACGNMTHNQSPSPQSLTTLGVKYVGEENAQHLLNTV